MIRTLRHTAAMAACAVAGTLFGLLPATAHAASTGEASVSHLQLVATAGPASSATDSSQRVSAYSTAAVKPLMEDGRCNYTNAEPVVGFGNAGVVVKQVQCELDEVYGNPASGSPLTIDGNFGTQTRAWVEFFQAGLGLTDDGIVGPKTWPLLDYFASQAPR